MRAGLALAGLVVLAVVLALLGPPVQKQIEVAGYPLTYDDLVSRWADEYKVDPYLVFAVIRTESGFDPRAESSAGARGLMQMTEDTFEWIRGKIAAEEPLTFEDLYDPSTSIRFGVCYLALSLERYGQDVPTAAAAYHSGWGTVDRLLAEGAYTENGLHLTEFPYSQMNHYVGKVTKSYAKYRELYDPQKET